MIEKTNVLLSTDIGTDVDDAVALYLAMNSPIIDLQGVYVTNGPVKDRARIAKHMANLAQYEVPVMVGESDAMMSCYPQYIVGTEGVMAPKKVPGIKRKWLTRMSQQLEQLSDVVVASIAPLTNIARLLEKKPEAAKKIKSLYVMGGREGHNEHNFTHDALAAEKVLSSDLDVVLVSADVCSRYECDIWMLQNLYGSEVQEHLAHMASLWKLYHDTPGIFGMGYMEKIEKRIIENIRGAKVTVDEYQRWQGVRMYIMMLGNANNFRDDPEQQLEMFDSVRIWANSQESIYAKAVLDHIKENELKTIKVSDAFVIYAIEHPERIKEKRVTAVTDEQGIMTTREGDRHRLIVDVDYRHFANYLKRRLEQKPRTLEAKTRKIQR